MMRTRGHDGRRTRRLRWALTGCQGVFDLPLPGSRPGRHVYQVTVEFRDVLDLVPQSAVKVNDVTVGAVDKITLEGWHAQVRLRLRDDVKLPDNAVAELRQTSLLGEKFVSLSPPPTHPPQGRSATGTPSRSRARAETPRSRRCSARCRWCSTAAGWPSSRPSTSS
jgi:virulence factor Mce-like protein